jgi:uncharacterized membrane protein YvbJ
MSKKKIIIWALVAVLVLILLGYVVFGAGSGGAEPATSLPFG